MDQLLRWRKSAPHQVFGLLITQTQPRFGVWSAYIKILNTFCESWRERERQTAGEYPPSLWRGCSAYHCSGILKGDMPQGSQPQKHNKWTWSPTWSLNTTYHSPCSAGRLWLCCLRAQDLQRCLSWVRTAKTDGIRSVQADRTALMLSLWYTSLRVGVGGSRRCRD